MLEPFLLERLAQSHVLADCFAIVLAIDALPQLCINRHHSLNFPKGLEELGEPFTLLLLPCNVHATPDQAMIPLLQLPAAVLDQDTDKCELRFHGLNLLHSLHEF